VFFLGLLRKGTNIGAGLSFQVAIVHYVLAWLIGDDCLHGVVEGWIIGGLVGRSEEGVVQGVGLVQGWDGLLGGVDVIANLIDLEVALGLVDAVSRVVVKGSSQRCVVELFPIVHMQLAVIIKNIDLIGWTVINRMLAFINNLTPISDVLKIKLII
jgi:hypothetical protein